MDSYNIGWYMLHTMSNTFSKLPIIEEPEDDFDEEYQLYCDYLDYIEQSYD